MAPLILAAAGGLALGIASAILRGFGPRYRVGRLLAVVPRVTVAEALELANAGEPRYVRIEGRIDSDAEFEDQDHRPLVYRRTSMHWRRSPGRGGWTPLEDPTIESMGFTLNEGLEDIAIDAQALGDGLVVIARESTGLVRDLGERAPEGVPADAELRLRIEYLSSIDHATVLGVPARGADGVPAMGPGLGRPLIVTTLENEEAMRVLTGGAIGRSRAAVAGLAIGAILIAAAAIWFLLEALLGGGVAIALAATPEPTVRPGSDIRGGGAAGFLGTPLLAVGAVLAIGVISVVATLAYVRLTGGPRGGR
ncbi:MAG TPA: hypothetical protein VM451_03075 [Candidatus Limnocylindria bacterium]|nr:hypothetical protein [Candidatus Limnocylindria bacterium]